MNILSAPLEFEWDKSNAGHIKDGHGIEPHECEQVFFNLPLVLSPDVKHSGAESRYYLMGRTDADMLLLVVFTIRASKIRVVTARALNRKERKIYYESIKENS